MNIAEIKKAKRQAEREIADAVNPIIRELQKNVELQAERINLDLVEVTVCGDKSRVNMVLNARISLDTGLED